MEGMCIPSVSRGPEAGRVWRVRRAQTDGVGENPYALRFSPDGSILAVANYAGEVEEAHTASSIALLDGDPTSPTFLQAKTWLVNK